MTVHSIVFKLTKVDTPDMAQMNTKVREVVSEAIKSDRVDEILKLGEDGASTIDILDDDYMEWIGKIKPPDTKIELLKKMLLKALAEFIHRNFKEHPSQKML